MQSGRAWAELSVVPRRPQSAPETARFPPCPLPAIKDGAAIRAPNGPDDPSDPRDHWASAGDYWDQVWAGDPDEALAAGHSTVTSKAQDGFTVTRSGDRITLYGEVTHEGTDPYDFHDGLDGWIGEPARDQGGAREYDVSATRTQHLTAEFKIVDGELVPVRFDWRAID